MADTKITQLQPPQLGYPVVPATDVLPIVVIADPGMATSGSTRKVTVNQLLGAGGTATLASATITGDLTVRTNKLAVTSTGVGIVNASPAYPLDVNGAIQTTSGSAAGLFQWAYGASASSRSWRAWNDVSANGDFQISTSTTRTGSTYSDRYRIDVSGVHEWSNTSGLAMTLNSTGLGVGETAVNGIKLLSAVTTAGLPATSGTTQSAGSLRITATNTTGCLDIGTSGVLSWLQACRRTNLADNFDLALNPNGGNVGIGVTPAGTGGCLQLKSGITFPATQVASSDPNTLDDYEEGTWTANLEGGTTNPTTPVTATGTYTKIGRQVTIDVYFNNVNTTGASGPVIVTGLPFSTSSRPVGSLALFNFDLNTGTSLFCDISGSVAFFNASKTNGAWVDVLHNAGAGRYARLTATYSIV